MGFIGKELSSLSRSYCFIITILFFKLKKKITHLIIRQNQPQETETGFSIIEQGLNLFSLNLLFPFCAETTGLAVPKQLYFERESGRFGMR